MAIVLEVLFNGAYILLLLEIKRYQWVSSDIKLKIILQFNFNFKKNKLFPDFYVKIYTELHIKKYLGNA